MNDAERFTLWDRWLQIIYEDAQNLLIGRYIYREVQAIVRDNPAIQEDSSFYDWMAYTYAGWAVVGVRRLVDKGPDSVSLANLLKAVAANPQALSREHFVALYKDSNLPLSYGEQVFDKHVGPGASHVSGVAVATDLDELEQAATSIRRYVNKRVAHRDRADFSEIPTFDDLDKALDLVEALVKKYWFLFRAETLTTVVPVWQYDWKVIFRVPWMP
jgi:hypothetical protein